MPDTTSYITAVETAIWNIWLEDGEWALVVKTGNRIRRDLGLDSPAKTNVAAADFVEADLIKGGWSESPDIQQVTLGNENAEGGCIDMLTRLRTQDFVLTLASATKNGSLLDWVAERAIDLLWAAWPNVGSDYVERIAGVRGEYRETTQGTARGTERLVANARIQLILRLPVGEVPAVTP